MDTNKIDSNNSSNEPKNKTSKKKKAKKNLRNMGSSKELEPTHQEHGLRQVARAHAPCMGAWTPSAWALEGSGYHARAQHVWA